MIALGDIYKVVEAMAPLYFALGLGYGSVRWWRFFTAEQCGAINTLVVCFSMPFFTFDFVVRADPYAMNYRVIAADAVAKLLAVLAAAVWARCAKAKAGAYSWSITGFSLGAYNNTLVVGVPLLDAMYGKWAQDLIVQIAVVQAILWFPLLLLAFELRKAWVVGGASSLSTATVDLDVEAAPPTGGRRIRLWPMASTVGMKLARNPNVYASVLGVAWACIAYRWRIGMPGIVTGSLQVMSRTGTGMSMFSMGLFMAQQERIVACGGGLAALGMVLRFVAGPLAALAGAAAFGLRGDVLRFAIIQAALPQSIASFVFAKEYGLHADVLSTAVIFGTLVSLPVLIGYYGVLDIV
ncbi:probable auxin efflux carrier component 5c isoform X3 [Triticum dicoccoides]|uniref:probable auxin efflux carrier component 5c isoform X3 n=1 Tax=Triticum dicoccoides TaxID=85692 RepID=UPI001890C212|nr:probable auxin efflux carrier component 5c isoform X3 [Triticum dicoccoides]XP_044436825.1 probable auxin efflux carrier component 5c isoform X3 [Triticum aestivum]